MAKAKKLKSGSYRCLVYDYTQMEQENGTMNRLRPTHAAKRNV